MSQSMKPLTAEERAELRRATLLRPSFSPSTVALLLDALDEAERKVTRMRDVLQQIQHDCVRPEDEATYDLIGTVADIWGQT